MTNSVPEIENADCILVMGSNTTGQHPMVASKIMRAKARGAKLVVVDPRRIPLCEYADLFLQIKPGTNVALINAMIHVMEKKKLLADDFIKERTEGIEALLEKVKEYPPEKAAEIIGVEPGLIEKAAEAYAKAEKSMLLYAMGVTQHTSGTDQVKSVANLAMAAGQIGRESTGVNPLRGQNNVQGACDVGALPNVCTGYQKVEDSEIRKKFKEAWKAAPPEKPGLTVVEMIKAAKAGDIQGMYIVGENPMISDPDLNQVKVGLEKLKFLVVQDIFMTETAKLADVVLPAASWAEREGTFTNTDRRVQRVRKAVEPPGEARPDWQIVCELARQMGAEGFDFEDPSKIMEEINSVTPSYGGITYQRLDQGEVLHWPCPDKGHKGTPFLHKDQFARGKGLFHAVDYTEPGEVPDKDYPYLLTTGRVPFHFHGGSMTRRVELLDQEVPTGYADVHPDDAKKLKVKTGDKIKIASRRGEIEIAVRVTEEVEAGVVYIPMHFAECAANVLTDTRLDPVCKIPGYKVCGVKIEKA
jgi:formate dehydrogenase alpha subunit